MNKKRYMMALFFGFYWFTNQGAVNNKDKRPDIKIANEQKSTNNINVEVHEQRNPNDCSGLIGPELVEKMRWQDDVNWRENLVRIGSHQRMMYANSLFKERLEQELERLKGDGEQELLKRLGSSEGQQFITVIKKRFDEHQRDLKWGRLLLIPAAALFLYVKG